MQKFENYVQKLQEKISLEKMNFKKILTDIESLMKN